MKYWLFTQRKNRFLNSQQKQNEFQQKDFPKQNIGIIKENSENLTIKIKNFCSIKGDNLNKMFTHGLA